MTTAAHVTENRVWRTAWRPNRQLKFGRAPTGVNLNVKVALWEVGGVFVARADLGTAANEEQGENEDEIAGQ